MKDNNVVVSAEKNGFFYDCDFQHNGKKETIIVRKSGSEETIISLEPIENYYSNLALEGVLSSEHKVFFIKRTPVSSEKYKDYLSEVCMAREHGHLVLFYAGDYYELCNVILEYLESSYCP